MNVVHPDPATANAASMLSPLSFATSPVKMAAALLPAVAVKKLVTSLTALSKNSAYFGLVTDLFRPRRFLLAENVLLRQQLLVLRRMEKPPSE